MDQELEISSRVLATSLATSLQTPSEAASAKEISGRIERALEAMEPLDRMIIALRHFEQLSNSEVAAIIQLTDSAASQRYLRAIKKLRKMLGPLFDPDARSR